MTTVTATSFTTDNEDIEMDDSFAFFDWLSIVWDQTAKKYTAD